MADSPSWRSSWWQSYVRGEEVTETKSMGSITCSPCTSSKHTCPSLKPLLRNAGRPLSYLHMLHHLFPHGPSHFSMETRRDGSLMVFKPFNSSLLYISTPAMGPAPELEEREERTSLSINGETEGLWLGTGVQGLDPI